MAEAPVEVVVQDRQVIDAVKVPDGCAPDEGAVGDAVVVNGRHVGVDEADAPLVVIERVRRHVEVGKRIRQIRVADEDPGIVVALEVVLVDQEVRARRPAHELVRVDASAGRRTGLIVVFDQVVADEHLRRACVGEPDANDVVPDDVVQDLRAGGPSPIEMP